MEDLIQKAHFNEPSTIIDISKSNIVVSKPNRRPREEDEITTSSMALESMRSALSGRLDPADINAAPLISLRKLGPRDIEKVTMMPGKLGLLDDTSGIIEDQ